MTVTPLRPASCIDHVHTHLPTVWTFHTPLISYAMYYQILLTPNFTLYEFWMPIYYVPKVLDLETWQCQKTTFINYLFVIWNNLRNVQMNGRKWWVLRGNWHAENEPTGHLSWREIAWGEMDVWGMNLWEIYHEGKWASVGNGHAGNEPEGNGPWENQPAGIDLRGTSQRGKGSCGGNDSLWGE